MFMTESSKAKWPKPKMKAPSIKTIQKWDWDLGQCKATDGCWTDQDNVCEHGYPSWMLYWDMT